MRIRDIVNSHVLQLDHSRTRKFSNTAKSRVRTRKFAPIKCMRIRDIVNSRVRAT